MKNCGGFRVGVHRIASAPYLLLLLALLMAALVYRPGLDGPFVFDDGLNIVNNQPLRLQEVSKESLGQAAFSSPNGVFGRPLSMLSFAANFYADKDQVTPFPSAYSFKLTNLAIHLLNGLAVFMLTCQLVALYRERRQADLPATYPQWLALAVSAAWLLHPLNVTGVLYVVQRMASLAALFSFAGLALYLWGRRRLCNGQRGGLAAILVSLFVFMPLAVLSKENGILVPLFMLALEIVLFRFETARPQSRKLLIAMFALIVVLPVVLVAGYFLLHPEWLLVGYGKRDFTLPQRLMTEARIVWFYLRLIVLPSTALMGLYHDDIAVSRSLLDPASTLPAIIGILALISAAWWLRRRQPLLAYGIVFFLIGHSLESTIYPLELVHEHRNYLPMFGILLAFFHLLLAPAPAHAVTLRVPRRALACLLIALFAVGTLSRANQWSSAQSLWSEEVEHHPASLRAHLALGGFYANALALDPAARVAYGDAARQVYEQALAINKLSTEGLFGLIQLSQTHGLPLKNEWLSDLNYSLQHEAIPSNTNDRLIALAMCRRNDACPLNAAEVDLLMHAPLNNPRVAGRDRALIYNALTVYFFNVVHDYARSTASARSAVALDPMNMDNQLWLATCLIAMHQTEEAHQQIAVLKTLDIHKRRTNDIAQVEQQLTEGH